MASHRAKKRKRAKKAHHSDRWFFAGDEQPHRRPRDEQLITELRSAADRFLDTRSVTLRRLEPPDATRSIAFGHLKAPLVYVFRDQATVIHGERPPIRGNFRGPGEHWDALRVLLMELQTNQQPTTDGLELQKSLTALPSSMRLSRSS